MFFGVACKNITGWSRKKTKQQHEDKLKPSVAEFRVSNLTQPWSSVRSSRTLWRAAWLGGKRKMKKKKSKKIQKNESTERKGPCVWSLA
jgi:hypothetical protein